MLIESTLQTVEGNKEMLMDVLTSNDRADPEGNHLYSVLSKSLLSIGFDVRTDEGKQSNASRRS